MGCTVCGGQVVEVSTPLRTKWRGVTLVLRGVVRDRCLKCGEEFFNYESLGDYERVRNREYRQKITLSARDVIRIRKKLKLSQEGLEKKLNLGPKVVTRWEQGKVRIPGPVNVLLRI